MMNAKITDREATAARRLLLGHDPLPLDLRAGVTLPGARMQWMFEYPKSWPNSERAAKRPVIEMSYSLSPESHHFYEPGELGPGQPYGNLNWVNFARDLRPHERHAPPASPGFWDKIHRKFRKEKT